MFKFVIFFLIIIFIVFQLINIIKYLYIEMTGHTRIAHPIYKPLISKGTSAVNLLNICSIIVLDEVKVYFPTWKFWSRGMLIE